jgi:cystathionine beta-lyase
MSSSNDEPSNPQKTETRLVTAGRDTKGQRGFVNPAVFHGSTVLYPTAEDLHAHRAEFSYGRHGSPTTLRLHIGLENVDDLKADLERGFAALKAAA